MGHSSYFIQLDGVKILVDPVFSGNASPVSFTTKAYAGSDVYTPEDMPAIDYLFITHDHWDHLDYPTMRRLRNKVKKVICGLGVGAHLERWGYASESIIEQDWYESFKPKAGWEIHALPARHFSGRVIKRNQTLWVSFALISPVARIYMGGDSGYGKHFLDIGERYGPFDLAILENGQYDVRWKYIHMLPGEQLQAAKALRAYTLLPVHSSKFTLATHDWDEPLKKIVENQEKSVRVITPMIGEKVNLDDRQQTFKRWWERDVR
jgi:L-ascorbate metabolism protein UlaG (beta-lactamase superfamily)